MRSWDQARSNERTSALTVEAETLGPLLKQWQIEAAHSWPDDREVLVARKLLASDWYAERIAEARREGDDA